MPAEPEAAQKDRLEKLGASVDRVILFIDDLDRCLPETIVDTFEAIRLFLNAPKTAYLRLAGRFRSRSRCKSFHTVVRAGLESQLLTDVKKKDIRPNEV